MDAVKLEIHRHPLNRRELSKSRVCSLCGKEVTNESAYECSQCKFTAHLDCAENPPPLVIEKRKIHEHTLTRLQRDDVDFTCDACGLSGYKYPYVCLKCCFMIDGDCIDFPGVMKISRHQHRLSHTWFRGPGKWNCGVCLRDINGRYGAYNCTKGCRYAVHLRCALRGDVWDGVELEGIPEEVYEDAMSFKVVDRKIIVHFLHQHVLRLQDIIRDVVCSGCSFPIISSPYYSCLECGFFLHEECAKLPRRMSTFLHVHKLTLCTEGERSGGPNGLSRCNACDLHFNGFSYRCFKCDVEFDVRCSSVSEPFQSHLHPHLFLFKLPNSENEEAKKKREEVKFCSVCDHQRPGRVLSCTECEDFRLCFACATLPNNAIYKYDDHFLFPAISEEDGSTNPDWCDVCENKIEGKKHRLHYHCSHCGPVLHTDCAVGSFRNMRPGFSFITPRGHNKYEVILNNWTSVMLCSHCHNDCNEPLLLMSTSTTTSTDDDTIYLCSSPCFDAYVSV